MNEPLRHRVNEAMLAAAENCGNAEFDLYEDTYETDLGIMAPIKDALSLKKLVCHIIDTTQLPPEASEDSGAYYLFIASYPIGHLIYTLKTLYCLAVADKRIYIEYGDAEQAASNDIRMIFIETLAQRLPNVVRIPIASRELYWGKREQFIAEHPDIRHAVCIGDALNVGNAINRFRDQGLCIHRPGMLLVYVDYSNKAAFDADELFHRFGNICADELVDLDAYHNPKLASSSEVYVGFDYTGLLWEFPDMVEYLDRIGVPRDKCVTLIFSDREAEALQLPPCIFGENFQLLRGAEIDLSKPMYDFDQLFKNRK